MVVNILRKNKSPILFSTLAKGLKGNAEDNPAPGEQSRPNISQESQMISFMSHT